jgi:hypothetical protein
MSLALEALQLAKPSVELPTETSFFIDKRYLPRTYK